MKIEIEKVQKIKPFEPFVIKIQFDSVDEVRDMVDQMNRGLDKRETEQNLLTWLRKEISMGYHQNVQNNKGI